MSHASHMNVIFQCFYHSICSHLHLPGLNVGPPLWFFSPSAVCYSFHRCVRDKLLSVCVPISVPLRTTSHPISNCVGILLTATVLCSVLHTLRIIIRSHLVDPDDSLTADPCLKKIHSNFIQYCPLNLNKHPRCSTIHAYRTYTLAQQSQTQKWGPLRLNDSKCCFQWLGGVQLEKWVYSNIYSEF